MSDIVEYLRKNAVFNYKDTYIAAADEIERLRKQRDEARQEVCVAYCDRIGVILCGDTTPQDYAKQRGWDCFDNLSETT